MVGTIRGLADRPRPHGARKLQGYDDVYRIRVGKYRIVYEVFDDSDATFSLVRFYPICVSANIGARPSADLGLVLGFWLHDAIRIDDRPPAASVLNGVVVGLVRDDRLDIGYDPI